MENHKLLISPADADKIKITVYCNRANTDDKGNIAEPLGFVMPEPYTAVANVDIDIPKDTASIAVGVAKID